MGRGALAIVCGSKIYRTLINGYPVVIYTDHQSLKYMFNNKGGSSHLARWHVAIADFDIMVEYLPGKENGP